MWSLRNPLLIALFAVALSLFGCGDEDGGNGGTRDTGNGADAGADVTPDATSDVVPDTGSGEAPEITGVAWTQAGGCAPGTASAVTIETTVTDADTAAGDLTISGSVTSCTGSIDSASATVTCPQLSTYSGSVTVTDPEGNSDNDTFTFGPCESGSL